MLALEHLLDVAQQLVLVDADQRHRLARRAGAAGTADAMHVVLGNVGQIVVHHMRQFVDVDAACGDVGGDQHVDLQLLEIFERALALALALVAMQCRSTECRP